MTLAAMERHTLLKNELARYIQLLREHKNLERILVFGSLAAGNVHPWSDIDLVIIQETDLPFWHRLRAIRKLIQPKVGTDILVYTPEEWEEMKGKRPFFRHEILAKSKVVYERK